MSLNKDNWQKYEWKMKGDRKSPINKLSWSFRVDAKLHGNPDITDVIYFSLRRRLIDFKPEAPSPFSKNDFEYTYDMALRMFSAIRHYFFVDKKIGSLWLWVLWESVQEYKRARPQEKTRTIICSCYVRNVES